MSYYNFGRLIEKYSSSFTAILPSKGSYNDSGIYVQGEAKKIDLRGAILNIRESKIYNSHGTLTTQDRQLFIKGELTTDLIGAKVIYKGKQYSVEEATGNSEFTGFSVYTLKYVSAFNEGATND